MLFPTVQFAIFFTIVLAISWALMSRPSLWKPFIIVASYVFYASASWRFCFLLAGVTAGNQLGAVLLHRTDDERRRRLIVGVTVALDLGVLGVFKYYGFFIQQFADALGHIGLGAATAAAHDRAAGRRQLLHLPGDLLRGRRQAAAGASPRAGSTSPSTSASSRTSSPGRSCGRASSCPSSPRRATPTAWRSASGLALIALGLVKKVVIADYLARAVVDPVFAVPQAYARARPADRRPTPTRRRSTATSPATPTSRSGSRC